MTVITPLQLTSAQGLFRDRPQLTPDKVKGVNPDLLSNMAELCQGRLDIKQVVWSHGAEVTSIQNAYQGSGVTGPVDLSFPKCTNASLAFDTTRGVSVVGLKLPLVTDVSYLFRNSTLLAATGIRIGTAGAPLNASSMFQRCIIDEIPGLDFSQSIVQLTSCFNSCTAKRIEFAANSVKNAVLCDGVFGDAHVEEIVNFDPDAATNLENCFYGTRSLRRLSHPVKTQAATTAKSMFMASGQNIPYTTQDALPFQSAPVTGGFGACTNFDNIFAQNQNIRKVNFGNTGNVQTANSWLAYSKLDEISAPADFSNCTVMTFGFAIPNADITKFRVTNLSKLKVATYLFQTFPNQAIPASVGVLSDLEDGSIILAQGATFPKGMFVSPNCAKLSTGGPLLLAMIEQLLVDLDSSGNSTLVISGSLGHPEASWSTAAQAAKANLVARGCTIPNQ